MTVIRASVPVDVAVRLYSRVELSGGAYSGQDTPIRWGDLETRHLRRLHVVFVSEDLDVITHVHPEDSRDGDGDDDDAEAFYLRGVAFPRRGRYAMLLTYEAGSSNSLTQSHRTRLYLFTRLRR